MSNVNDFRPLYEIALDIHRNWPNMHFAAIPYYQALCRLDGIHDRFMFDSAGNLVNYFLANASTWRGAEARRIKLELKSMLSFLGKGK